MDEQELEEIFAAGHEVSGVEFKAPGPRADAYLFASVTRAVLAMANRADGGLVIVGVQEGANGAPQPAGLSTPDLQTWNHDDVAAGLAPAADPFVTVQLEPSVYRGVSLLVIRVLEFETLPVICRRQFLDPRNAARQVLRDGAVYVRTRRKPETSEIPSQTEMRELLDLAIQKGVRRFVQLAIAGGLQIPGPKLMGEAAEDEQFDHDLGDVR
jgi:predicted HTH transcriptional regulator